MKNEDQQFDDFLRSAFEHKTFEQKDQYWENAQELIRAKRKGRSPAFMAFFFPAVVVVALSAGMLWNTDYTPVTEANQDHQTHNKLITPATIAASGNTAAGSTPETAGTSGSTQPENTPDQQHQSNPNNEKLPVAMLASYAASTGNGRADIPGRKASVAARSAKHPGKKASRLIAAEEARRNEALETGMIDSRFYRPLGQGTFALDSFNKKDAFLAYSIRQQKNFLTAEAGINCYNTGNGLQQAINFHAGLRYYYFVAPKTGISTGLSYSRIHQDLAPRTYRDIDYSFGMQATETRITTLRIDYIELPVDVHYRVTGNHFATAGALVGYAIQSGEYVEYNGGSANSARSNGHMDAIHKWDVQLHLGYNYFLNNRYTFSAGYYFGLMDVSGNAAFRSDKSDRNTGVRFTLGYKLF